MSSEVKPNELKNNASKALAIFTRAPVLHQTKTRLAQEMGAEGALAAHRELVSSTLTRLSWLEDVEISLWVTQVNEDIQAWSTQFELPVYLQQGEDLGERMHGALATLLGGGAQRACLVGTDCPDIDANYVNQAFTALLQSHVVLGPAQDGGYGLIGMRAANQTIFRDISWGSDLVRAQTLHQIKCCGWEVTELDEIWDVDVPADWGRYLDWKHAKGLK